MKKKVAALIVTSIITATLFVSGCNIQIVDDVDSSSNSNTSTSESLKDESLEILLLYGVHCRSIRSSRGGKLAINNF